MLSAIIFARIVVCIPQLVHCLVLNFSAQWCKDLRYTYMRMDQAILSLTV